MFFADRASGAYIFRPKTQRRKDFAPKGDTLLFEGPLLQEIQQGANSICQRTKFEQLVESASCFLLLEYDGYLNGV